MRRRTWIAVAATAVALGAPPASASVLIGEPTLVNSFSHLCPFGCVAGHDLAPTAGGLARAPFDGVLVGWRANMSGSGAGATVTLRTYTIVDANQATFRRTGASIAVPNGGFAVRAAATRTPIAKGDSFGVSSPTVFSVGGVNSGVTGANYRQGTGTATSAPDGSTQSYPGFAPNIWLNLNADLESDVDRDSFGDETQDACPTNAATQGACPAAAATTVLVPVPVAVATPAQPQVSARRATATLDRRGRSIALELTCPSGRTSACRGVVRAVTAKAVRLSRGRRKAQVVLGSGGYSGASGRSMKAKIALGAAARSLFVPGRKLAVQLQVTPVDGPVATKSVSLRKAKAKKRRR